MESVGGHVMVVISWVFALPHKGFGHARMQCVMYVLRHARAAITARAVRTRYRLCVDWFC